MAPKPQVGQSCIPTALVSSGATLDSDRAAHLLRTAADACASSDGVALLLELTRVLTESLGVRCAFLIEVLEDDLSRARLEIINDRAGVGRKSEYDTAGTPCARVLAEGEIHVDDRLADRFTGPAWLHGLGVRSYLGVRIVGPAGEPLGILGIADEKPLPYDPLLRDVLRIPAQTVASSMVRWRREWASLTRRPSSPMLDDDSQAPAFALRKVGDQFVYVGYNRAAEVAPIRDPATIVGRTAQEVLGARYDVIALIERCFRERSSLSEETAIRQAQTGVTVRGRLEFAFAPPDMVVYRVHENGDESTVTDVRWIAEELERRVRSRTAALEESERRYRTLSEMTSDYVFEVTVRPDGRRKVRWVTDAVAQLTGYSLQELEAMGTMAPIVHEDDAAPCQAHIAALTDGRPSEYEVRLRHKDGSIRWQRIYVRPEPDPATPGGMRWMGAAKDITERKQAEEERARLTAQIEREHARLNAMMESVPALVWEARLPADGSPLQIEYVNDYAEALTGYSPAEWLSTPDLALSIVHPEDRRAAARDYTSILARGHGVHPFRWMTKDGRTIWVEAHITVMRDARGQPAGVRGVTLDLTERRRTEETFIQQAALLELSYDAIIVRALDATITYWNRGAERLYGWSRDKALGRNVHQLLNPSPTLRPAPVDAFLRGASIWEGELTHVRSDGSEVIVDSRQVAVRNATGEPVAILETNRDITERKRIDAVLRENEARFRAVLENLPVGVLLQQPDASITLCNPAASALLGIAPQELIGRTSLDAEWDVIHEDGSPYPGPTHPVPQAIATRQPVRNAVMGVYREGRGDRVWLLVNAVPLLAEDGVVQEVICTFADISERRLAQQALLDSEARYRTIFETAAVGIWELDFSEIHAAIEAAGVSDARSLRRYLREHPAFIARLGAKLRIVDLNQAAIRMIGAHSKEEALSSFWKIATPELFRTFEREIVAITGRRTRRDIRAEVRIRTFDGEMIDALLAVRMPRTVAGLSSVLIGTMDITEHKRAERELRETEYKLQAIVDTTPAVIYIKDDAGRYLLVNQSFKNLWHISKEDALGRTDEELFGAETAESFRANDHAVWETGTAQQAEERRQDTTTGGIFLSTKLPLTVSSGSSGGTILSAGM